MPRLFLTGASGLLGRAFLQEAVAPEFEITLGARTPSSVPAGLAWQAFDLDTASLDLDLRGFEVVLHLAYQPIATDLVAQKLGALCRNTPTQRIEEIGGPEVISLREGIEQYRRQVPSKTRIFYLPRFLLGKMGRALTTTQGQTPGTTWLEYLAQKESRKF